VLRLALRLGRIVAASMVLPCLVVMPGRLAGRGLAQTQQREGPAEGEPTQQPGEAAPRGAPQPTAAERARQGIE
jgi:hypothetical protein